MTSFAVTWDYRCPFARNAHDHVVTGLRGGADWDVRFVPFSLGQVHVAEGDPDVWDAPETDSGLFALMAAVSVRDQQPAAFLAVHQALFDARHLDGLHLRDEAAVLAVIDGAGADAAAALDDVRSGRPLGIVRDEHNEVATSHDVWGVPTFIVEDQAAFVRYMNRSEGDVELARRTVERTVDLLGGWPELNEFKHTSVPF
jgi:DSBA-like thioredoxin domain